MISKRFFSIASSFCLILALVSCAAHKSSDGSSADGGEFLLESSNATGQMLSLAESNGKVIVDIPLDSDTEIFADYDASKNVVVSFDPAVSAFCIPEELTPSVKSFETVYEGEKIKSLLVSTNVETKFLLSRQSASSGRLMLVADSLVSPSVPTNKISSVKFRPNDGSLRIFVNSEFPFEIVPEQRDSFTLLLASAKFQDLLIKKYDVSKLATTVSSVTASNEDENAVLIFSDVKNPKISVKRMNGETVIDILKDFRSAPAVKNDNPSQESSERSDEIDDMVELNTLFPGMKKNYTGAKISIDLQDADIEHVLRLISEISGHNLILDQNITGKISLKLVDIPWDQALDLILQQKNLGMVLKGNIMRIATSEQIQTERDQLQKAREAAAKAKESLQVLAPLKTEYIQINYNTAADFEGKVKSLLSSRGKVTSDPRTNILIVTDTEYNLARVNSFIKKLDRAERQVLIEARIVYATDEFQRSLGVQWGTDYSTETDEKLLGEQYRGTFQSTAMNMLNTVNGITLGGEIGKYLGKDLFTLDASLQLGETKNLVKTISSPRILTLNNNRAEIKQGTKLATATESESGGTTTEYEEAVLKISVLPQITPDNKLILDLEISDDSPKSDGRDIDTKETKTKLMVGDRETIVIGGVQKSTETSGVNQIPGVGDVPGLGWLFKHDYKRNDKAELLIFIHPRIM